MKIIKTIAICCALLVASATAWHISSPLYLDFLLEEEFEGTLAKQQLSMQEQENLLTKIEHLTPLDVEQIPQEQRYTLLRNMEAMARKKPSQPINEELPVLPSVQPITIKGGVINNADILHRASGTANIYEVRPNAYVLRLETLFVQNSPNLSVYLTRHPQGKLHEEFINLGPLKSNKGNQNYDIPSAINPAEFNGVAIYNTLFGIPYGYATIR